VSITALYQITNSYKSIMYAIQQKNRKSITCAQHTLHICTLTHSAWVTTLSDAKDHTLSTSVFKHPLHHLLLNILICAFSQYCGAC